jgi:ribosomal protein L7/L12
MSNIALILIGIFLLVLLALAALAIVISIQNNREDRDAGNLQALPYVKGQSRPGESLSLQVRSLLAQGRKIEAIKQLRLETGLGLREAKDMIERNESSLFSYESSDQPVRTPPDLSSQVKELLNQGKKIEAIKLYRAETGLGLKEAKDAVDHIQREMK